MTETFQDQCLRAIAAFEESFLKMQVSFEDHFMAYHAFYYVREQLIDPNQNPISFCMKFRHFFFLFCSQLSLYNDEGIVLTEEANEKWNTIYDLVFSWEIREIFESGPIPEDFSFH